MEISLSKLQPLKIPSGWEVQINKFYDVDPESLNQNNVDAEDPVWMLFDNTLLFLVMRAANIVVDMGWVPMWEPDGSYLLEVSNLKNRGQVYLERRIKSKSEMVDLLNRVLAAGTSFDWDQKLKRL
jgi:hypothetical protein